MSTVYYDIIHYLIQTNESEEKQRKTQAGILTEIRLGYSRPLSFFFFFTTEMIDLQHDKRGHFFDLL